MSASINQQYNADREAKRKELEKVTPINSILEAKDYLNKLIDFQSQTYESWKNGGENERFFSFLKNALVVGTDGIYSNELRFLYELIQNVDDCKYEDLGNCNLSILFDTKNNQIVLEYNEKGFTTNNVFGISNIASTTKNMGNSKDMEIGEKGLGFKSVFGVADKVLIQSGYFSFSLSKENFIIPKAEYSNFTDYLPGTKMTLFVKEGAAAKFYELFLSQYKDRTNPKVYLNNNPVLFLNKLSSILFCREDKSYFKFSVTRNKEEKTSQFQFEDDVKVSVQFGKDYEVGDESYDLNFYRFSKEIIYDQKACKDRYKENCFFETKRHKIIALVFKSNNKKLYSYAFGGGSMYSFLPTAIRTTVPMIFHIPFKLNMSREGIDAQEGKNNKWFVTTIVELRKFIKSIYEHLSKIETNRIFNYLPTGDNIFDCKNEMNQAVFNSNAFKLKRNKNSVDASGTPWAEAISDYNIIPIVGGGYSTITNVCQVKGFDDSLAVQMMEIVDPTKKLVSSEIFAGYKQYGVKQYSEKEILGILFKMLIERPALTKRIVDLFEQVPIKKITDNVDFNLLRSETRTIKLNSNQVVSIFNSGTVREYFQSFLLDEPEKRFLENFALLDTNLAQLREEDLPSQGILQFLKTVKGRKDNGFINGFSEINFVKLRGMNENFYFLTRDSFYYADLNKNLLRFFDTIQNNITDPLSRIKNVNAWLNVEISNLEFKKKIENNAYLNANEFILDLRENNERTKQNLGKYYKKILQLIDNSWSDPKRYIHELLQNADDCKYEEDSVPEFCMLTDAEGFFVSYNEKGFTQDNIRALTDIGDSTKVRIIENSEKFIGEKGIGFKSIFKVADFVEVHSGDYHFRLYCDEPTIPELIAGPHQLGTELYVHLKKPSKMMMTEDQLLKLTLGLKKIKKVTIDEMAFIVQDINGQRIFKSNRREYAYHKFDYEFKMSNSNLIERRKLNNNVDEIQKVTLYIPRDNKKTDGLIYNGLPSLCRVNIPVNIDANFILTASREGIVACRWNMELLDFTLRAYNLAVHELKHDWGVQVLRLITTGKLFEEEILKHVNVDFMKDEEILPSVHENVWIKPSKAIVIDDFEANLAEKVRVSLNKNVIKYSSSTIGYKEKLKNLGATIKSFADTLSSAVCDYQIEKYLSKSKDIRDLFYGYMKQNINNCDYVIGEIFEEYNLCPVKMGKGQTDFIQYQRDELFYSTSLGDVSEKGLYYILEEAYLAPDLASRLFKNAIPRFDDRYRQIYVIERIKKLLDIQDIEERALAFYGQFKSNYTNFERAIRDFDYDDLQKIPVLTRAGEYVSESDRFIYEGKSKIFNAFFVAEEWEDFARFIKVPYIVEVENINDLPRKFYDSPKSLLEMLKIKFDYPRTIYSGLIMMGRISQECLRNYFFDIVDAADLSIADMQNMRISDIGLSLQEMIEYTNLISAISTKCMNITFSVRDAVESERIDRPDLTEMIKESLEDTLGHEEKQKVNQWISSENLYQSYLDESIFIKTEKGNYSYLNKNAKFDTTILSEIENLIYLLTNTKPKLKKEMHAYSNKDLAKRITARPYTKNEVQKLIRKSNFYFSDRESIKDYLSRPTLIDGVVYGGYAKHCPLCGARVHTELTGFRHYVLKQEYSDKGKTKQYKFDIICCKNCFDVFMYCESYWVNVEKWLNEGLLEVRVIINGEYWESKIFRPRLAHQALLEYKNLK